ncbi:MAG: PfkB family carbohydrate kinase [Caldilineaceae bacterium]|nr:PfkB family carbohydrate kinase [Caldilineaceae bacterium]
MSTDRLSDDPEQAMNPPPGSIQCTTISNVIIDDIVLWDGRTYMGTLGGSGSHAVVGMRTWNEAPLGLVGYLGDDAPEPFVAHLQRLGVSPVGLVHRAGLPTPRAWQLFEADGQRTEVFRTSLSEFVASQVRFDELNDELKQSSGFHVQWGGSMEETTRLVRQLKMANPSAVVVFEPIDDFLGLDRAAWAPLLQACDVFLPNLEEAATLTGEASPAAMAAALLDWGADRVVIRMAEQGIWVQDRQGNRWQIPAVPTQVVDVTGAGNAFCGGLLAGLVEDLPFLETALRGLVGASFAIEQVGVPETLIPGSPEAFRRLDWARGQVRNME